MKLFSAGYRPLDPEQGFFSDIAADFREHLREVYFAWPEDPSGRGPLPHETIGLLEEELPRIRAGGIRLNLLLNAACYGGGALSTELADHVYVLVRHVSDLAGVDTVTTMSPLIAALVKRQFPMIDVRASVNMRIGTAQGMAYAAHLFDSYNVRRECNRDPVRLARLQDWASRNGKALFVLANSGCLNHCTFQTFHDNAVAHEAEIRRRKNGPTAATLCRAHYADPAHWVSFLQGSWIRPEDIEKHRAFFHGGYKLATRAHDNPRMVIHAYATRRFYGDLLELMEPGHGPAFQTHGILNGSFPEDWFDRTTRCVKNCESCDYCHTRLQRALIRFNAPAADPDGELSGRQPSRFQRESADVSRSTHVTACLGS